MSERLEVSVPTVPAVEAIPDATIADADVVARVLAGDTALFELLMRRYNRLLFRLARGIVRDDDEARDVVQAAYVRAYYDLGRGRDPQGNLRRLAALAIQRHPASREATDCRPGRGCDISGQSDRPVDTVRS
jgi:hypothetical protein